MPLSYCSYGQSCEMFNEVLVDSHKTPLLPLMESESAGACSLKIGILTLSLSEGHVHVLIRK